MTKLQYLRKEKFISQFELAKRTGVSIKSIQKYEQGVYPIEGARVDRLIAMSEVLGCKVWEIIDNEMIARKLKEQCYAPTVQGAKH